MIDEVETELVQLVERLRRLQLADERVAEALLSVPRRRFLGPEAQGAAYRDEPLGIGEGQTISAPHMVAMMATWLDLHPGQRVLEVGAGSGWHAAVAAHLVTPGGTVVTVERLPALAARARENLARAGFGDRVEVLVGDGSAGAPGRGPFDRIFVAAAAPGVPPPLLDQLAPGGRLLIPVGSRWGQELRLFQNDDPPQWRDLGAVRFVPLLGEWGFPP